MLKRLLIFGYPLLEVSTAWALIIWLGFGWTFVIYVSGIPIGWLVFKHAGRRALDAAHRQEVPPATLAFQVLAGVLFMIPGIWTDIFALLCLIPYLQKRMSAPFANMSTSPGNINWRMSSWSQGSEIIEGVVIHENDDPFDSGSIER
ncbi:MAG: hypothetical protein F2923_07960 [Actinobacteria bacterium]|uniref:Unannotated protein n=1 Tax=freshwater metagenome TaxID=449393 RepID=A0A6J7F5J2_9ZZZZ|nr:hypothetical protein [Actinomycetota bacterium]MTB28557.1 hypothetical protein [Actinomycetota bacterium]